MSSTILKLVRARPRLDTDQLALAGGAYFGLASNTAFLAGATAGRSWGDASTWAFAAVLLAMLVALHTLLLGLVLQRRLARPVLALLLLAAAFATYYMGRYGVYIDPTMLRNVMHTQLAEARELLGWSLLPHLLLFAGLPLLLLWRVQLRPRPRRQALLRRAGLLAAAFAVLAAGLLLLFQDLAGLMRNQRELRYLITPANAVYSVGRVLSFDSAVAAGTRRVVGADARLSAAAGQRTKPVLLVLVLGETARAANWGLNGYARQTTPELATLDVLNFSDVTACGTNTETSVPCMFAPVGRRDYDEKRIRGSESLLHVLARAGYQVRWLDNQAGCKGVCQDLPAQQVQAADFPGLCDGERCLDAALVQRLQAATQEVTQDTVLVLHMLGNHGPAYHQRYPAEFRRFTPTCDTADLRRCTREQIVNAYDNALLYTDHLLAQSVRLLQAAAPRLHTGLLYVSDHGESLGEGGLYLHGVPYAIAPAEQTRVPMVWWLSPGLAAAAAVDARCLQAQAGRPWSHDNLFHSMLGLLGVETSVHERSLDITGPCAP